MGTGTLDSARAQRTAIYCRANYVARPAFCAATLSADRITLVAVVGRGPFTCPCIGICTAGLQCRRPFEPARVGASWPGQASQSPRTSSPFGWRRPQTRGSEIATEMAPDGRGPRRIHRGNKHCLSRRSGFGLSEHTCHPPCRRLRRKAGGCLPRPRSASPCISSRSQQGLRRQRRSCATRVDAGVLPIFIGQLWMA